MLFDWLVVGQVIPTNPASAVHGPIHLMKNGSRRRLAGLALAKSDHPVAGPHLFPVLGYFSFITLFTIEFGDITPLTLPMQGCKSSESLRGKSH
jgi:hypothetical protein